MKTMPRLLFAAVLLLATPVALGWAQLGHRLVGELAQRHLTPAADAEVARLLAGEQDPTLAGIAAWADTLRDEDPPRFKATSKWHYVNTAPDDGCRYDAARDCADGNCVVGALEAQLAILPDRSQPDAARRDALKFVVHLVGDVHQPLHATDHTDAGGNGYQISLRTDLEPEAYARKHYAGGVMGTNLHSVWDYYILGTAGFGADRAAVSPYADRLDTQPWPPTAEAGHGTPEAWAGESCRLVDAHGLYPPGHKLDKAYLDQYRPLAEQRVRRAAYRLALVLNQALGN